MNTETIPPLTIDKVTLIVHDLDHVRDFYERDIGLHLLKGAADAADLGVGSKVLLSLRQDKSARENSRRNAGLFHTAFLLPGREDLARWLIHAGNRNLPLLGASDHLVSEAIYLADPEGNGIEIYRDRPRPDWNWQGDTVKMSTTSLDIADLLKDADSGRWNSFPEGSTVGHVHLQVGALAPAEEFYAGMLGFDITCRYQGATFYSTGRYHHHLAANIWNSRGTAAKTEPTTGLADIELAATETGVLDGIRRRAAQNRLIESIPDRLVLSDPWNTRITVTVNG